MTSNRSSESKNREDQMYRRNIISISAMTVLGLILLPGNTVAQQKPFKEQLTGTWTLGSWEQVFKDGTKRQDFGTNPKGVASFEPNGHFFVMFSRPDLPKIAST